MYYSYIEYLLEIFLYIWIILTTIRKINIWYALEFTRLQLNFQYDFERKRVFSYNV